MFDNFFGNPDAVQTIERMIKGNRIPQTILFDGPEGAGKATLARRFRVRVPDGYVPRPIPTMTLRPDGSIPAELEARRPACR